MLFTRFIAMCFVTSFHDSGSWLDVHGNKTCTMRIVMPLQGRVPWTSLCTVRKHIRRETSAA